MATATMATATLNGFSPVGYDGFRDPDSRSESGDQITVRFAIAPSPCSMVACASSSPQLLLRRSDQPPPAFRPRTGPPDHDLEQFPDGGKMARVELVDQFVHVLS